MQNNLNTFLFHDDATSAETSAALSNPNSGSLLTIEVSGESSSVELVVQGVSDPNNDGQWSDLAILDSSNMDLLESINKNGIYLISIDGVKRVRTDLRDTNGRVRVFGTVIG